MSNYGKLAEPVNGSRLSTRTSRSAIPRHISYTSSKSRRTDDWEDWEDDDVVTLIDVDETPSADNSDKKLLFNSPFLNMSASSSSANTRSPSPVESDSASVSSDEDVTPIDSAIQPGLLAPPPTPAYILTKPAKNPSIKLSMRRSAAKVNRPISRKPPKQRNAKLGIKLITDMTKLRRQNHIAGQTKSPARRAPKFVDAAALRALEGSPNPQSVGNWNWLKKDDADRVADSPLQVTRSPAEQLSPEDRPIVIGITLPSDEVTSRGIDPLTATVNNIDTPSGGMKNPYPFTFQTANDRTNGPADSHQLKSVWSPDTPETASSFSTIRYPSSIYSQASMAPVMGLGLRDTEVPPVPAVPANYKRMTAAHQRIMGMERRKNAEEEDESGTPCTLFEEDGVTPLKSALTPQSGPGYWEYHVVTPYERTSFASRRTQMSPLNERGYQMARSADNKGDQGLMLTPKYIASPQSWKTPTSGVEAKQTFSPVENQEQRTNATVNPIEGSRAILGLSMLEKEHSQSESFSGAVISRNVKGKGLDNELHSGGIENSDILITLATDEDMKPFDKSGVVGESSTLTSQSGSHQQTFSESREATSMKTSTSEEVHRYNYTSTSIELRENKTSSADSQSKPELKRDLTPPPRPQWDETQAPILRVPAPRQTPPPREGVVQQAVQPIVFHIEINTGEQKQKFVVDRVAANSTPTIRIPTPRRRTPSPRGDVSEIATVTESARALSKRSVSSGYVENINNDKKSRNSNRNIGHSIRHDIKRDVKHGINHSVNQRSPVDQRRGGSDARAVQPIEIMLEEQRGHEDMPASPERAYVTINETHPGSGNWARAGSPVLEHGYTEPLPARPVGTSLSQSHADELSGKEHKIERKRRRHEKEEMVARRAGGLWRGRGPVSKKGCFGRTGPEGRKKRRIWLFIICILLLLIIILAVVLGIVLSRHHGSGNKTETSGQDPPSSTSPSTPSTPIPSSIWVNLTDYPAMPTGVLTFVGPNNTIAKSDCTEPSTLWSCSLPKDSQASVSPFKPNQPTLIFQIQWDNSTEKAWNIPNGAPPAAISQRDTSNSNSSIDGFNPDPSPPTFQEMWFLGETTDNIQSSQKAGEPTPFFISVLESVNDTVKSPSLSRRATASNVNISDIILPPDLQSDGTPAPAVMLPNPVQQPVRLFDRGLPTEHYGFYTYFQRTIFLKSVTVLKDSGQGNVPVDEDGGCSETEANHLVTWAETRMLVQIWTRKLNSTGSLLAADGSEGIDNSPELVKPGTMPYPVTVTLDTHGGDPNHKVVWEWPMDDRQKLNISAPDLLVNKMDAGGTWINHRGSGNAKFGGFDGGTGAKNSRTKQRSLVTLAIETSCDDTAVAVLEKSAGGKTRLLFNERVSSDNRAFKGIHPMVTVEGHNTALGPLVQRALASLRESAVEEEEEEEEEEASSVVEAEDVKKKRMARRRKSKVRVPDFVCATRGPGIMTNLAVGLNVAKGLALAWDVPLVGVHHMQAHALTPRLVDALEDEQGGGGGRRRTSPSPSPAFPFLSLLVSGGHTQLILSTALTTHRILATTADIAIGNLLDQTARVILPPALLESSPDVMYGRLLEAFAFPPGADTPRRLRRVLRAAGVEAGGDSRGSVWLWVDCAAAVSELEEACVFVFDNRNSSSDHDDSSPSTSDPMPLEERRALARHTLRAAFQHLTSRLILALQDSPSLQPPSEPIRTLVVAGGVASNRFLMHVLRTTLAARGFPDMRIVAPPLELCTDNAAMIAWAGMEMFEAGYSTELSVRPIAKWPMDPDVGGGILGAGGWVREEE
ncbi:hypothetical protein TrVGV298_005134 [Trichoderma virens]|nr:hypothetical protein TrVGV298_005134 [Trichoderma virens]